MNDRPVVPPPPGVPFPGSGPEAGSGVPAPSGVPFMGSRHRSGVPPAPAVPFPELWDASDAPPSAAVPFPELLGAGEPAPPARPRGSRLLRTLARVVLWSLIAVGALRGLVPATEGLVPLAAQPREGRAAAASGGSRDGNQTAAPGEPREDGRAVASGGGPRDGRPGAASDLPGDAGRAVAVAFLREYLTVGGDPAARVKRLGRFGATGVELRGSVSVPAGVSQYADLVVAAGSRRVAGGIEITVLAHVLQLRSGVYRDGGTVAFVVTLVVRRERVAVAGQPRPTSLPVASGVSLLRPRTAPADLPPAAGRLARQAVAAVVDGDSATLARLGGGRAPSIRSLPAGWRMLHVGTAEGAGPAPLAAEAAGSAGVVAAVVPVRARPPTGSVSYLVPVIVRLDTGPQGLTVRHVDAGGSP